MRDESQMRGSPLPVHVFSRNTRKIFQTCMIACKFSKYYGKSCLWVIRHHTYMSLRRCYSEFHLFCSTTFPSISWQILHIDSSVLQWSPWIKITFEVPVDRTAIRSSLFLISKSEDLQWLLPFKVFTQAPMMMLLIKHIVMPIWHTRPLSTSQTPHCSSYATALVT